jgi:hypothetical protein
MLLIVRLLQQIRQQRNITPGHAVADQGHVHDE